MTKGRAVRVGILGYGLAGRVFHANLIAATPGLEVAMIVTADGERAARARQEHPGAEVVADADTLFGRCDRLDAVVVATPNDSHVALAERAIASGLPVIVDKPLAPTVLEARRVVERAEEAGVLLTVFQNRRWDGDFLTVRELLADGRLGRIHRFESRFERWRPEPRPGAWREDPDPGRAGGLLYDLGAHVIDQALVLFGPATTVYAEVDRCRPAARVDDDVFVAMAHGTGTRSHLWVSSLVAQPGPRFRVLGDRAGYTKYGLDVQEAQLGSGLVPGSPGWGREGPDRDGTLGVGGDSSRLPTRPGAYEEFYGLLAAAVRGEGVAPVDPRDAVRTLEIIEAARRSAVEGRVVRLDG